MGTGDTYSGGGSIIRIGKGGRLVWTSSDPAENKSAGKSTMVGKVPKSTKVGRVPTDEKAEGKLIRSFISQCATAYAAEELDASRPEPPKSLKSRIKKSGGNVAWLSAQPSYQALFHKAYCRKIGKEIPIERVWDRTK